MFGNLDKSGLAVTIHGYNAHIYKSHVKLTIFK